MIKSGVKQGCVLAQTLFGIFFSMLLKHVFFCSLTVGIKLLTRSDGRLVNHARLKAKLKVKKITVRKLLFADDAALLAQDPQTLLNQFSPACSEFALTISLKTTKVLSQGTDIQPTIKIEDNYIKNVKNCVYLGSSIASNASKDTEINCHIGKVSGTFSQLSVRVWDDPKLAIRTKLTGYCACVCSTLLYGSKM